MDNEARRKTMLPTTTITRLLALAAMLSVLLAGVAQAQQAASPEAAALKGIKVSFQVDPRVTRGMYMGEQWVSPPNYIRVQEGENKLIVPAQAMGLDAKGGQVKINPTWKPGNADIVQVSPAQGPKVELTVLKEGQTDLTVTLGGVSKKLTVKAVRQHGSLRVDISQ
jgi:hypothetical protein